MASSLTELTEHSAVREVVGVKQDEAQAFALSLLPSLAVPWDTFVAGGLLSDRDVQLIRRFDKRDKFTQAALWEKEGSAYAAVFFNVLRSVSKDDTTQYVLALLEEAFVVDKERVKLFHGPHMGTPAPYMVLLRLLERTDWFIQDRASRVLCRLLSVRPDRGRSLGLAPAPSSAAEPGSPAAPAPSTPLPPGSAGATCLSFLDWAVRTLRSPGDPRCVAPATAALACLTCERELRPVAFRQGALGLLAPTLRSAGAGPHNVQLLYDAGLAVWLLTFYPPAAEGTLASGALAGLIETARGASKEKVVRVALQALRNLADCQEAPGARAAVQAAASRLAATLRLRAFHDDDLNEALNALEALGAAASGHGAAAQGSWERYRQEVLSGALDWGGARGDESFWRDHVPQLEEGNHALVKQLCAVLQAPSTPPRALAVACHDLGHIATAVPRGRAVIAETGAKAALLRLMTHDEEDVRKQALLATQKLLVVGWQYLG